MNKDTDATTLKQFIEGLQKMEVHTKEDYAAFQRTIEEIEIFAFDQSIPVLTDFQNRGSFSFKTDTLKLSLSEKQDKFKEGKKEMLTDLNSALHHLTGNRAK